MVNQLKILVHKISRIQNYVDKHNMGFYKISVLFKQFEDAIYQFQNKLSKQPNADNQYLQDSEWQQHIGCTNEYLGLDNMDAYDREQVYGKHFEHNIDRLGFLYHKHIKYYVISNGLLEPLTQNILRNYANSFTIPKYFPEATSDSQEITNKVASEYEKELN